MSFVYPSFLWALSALVIPIIVHLFNFRKAKKVYFSNVQFLESIKQKSSSKLRLKHLLVLISRLLFITALVMVFAQPYIPGKEDGLNSNAVTIYVDNSQSMSNRTYSDLTGLDESVAYLEQIINLYPRETKFRIITNDFSPSSINPKSQERALELSTELTYSNLTRTSEEILGKIQDDQNTRPGQDIYMISDFQSSSFNRQNIQLSDSSNSYHIIPIRYPSKNNIYLDTIYLENPFLISGQINKLHLRVRNNGEEDANDVILKLFVNERQAATASVDVDKNSYTETTMDINFRLDNINRCRISFEDFPITFDNDHYFVLNTLKRINIVELHAKANTPYIKSVFADRELFNFQHYEVGSIDYNSLSSADFIIINQPNKLDQSLTALLDQLIDNGKSVIIIPSDQWKGNQNIKVGGISILNINNTNRIEMTRPDLSNPFFSGIFRSVDNKTTMPSAQPFIYWNQSGKDLIELKNGLPFLTRFERTGTLYLISSPLSDAYTNFHKHALFVPIMYRIAALSSHNYFPLNYSMESPAIALEMDSIKSEELYKMIRGDQEFIPEQYTAGNRLLLDLPRYLINPGFYDLTYQNEVNNTLAFNNSKKESLPHQMSTAEIASMFSGVENFEMLEFDNAQSFAQGMKEKYIGLELWKYALILCLIFLMAETLFIRFL